MADGLVEAGHPGATKADVLEELGEFQLLLPSLVNRGLEANDRAKYLLSLFQAARARADAPLERFSSLREERLAAGIPDPSLDRVVEASRRMSADRYLVPQAARIHRELMNAVAGMLAPLDTAPAAGAPSRARLDALAARAPELTKDQVPGSYIDDMTSGDAEADSLHRLVMDAHRAINRLQAEIATATIDGAAVYGLVDEDHGLVAVFMAGVHETEALKLNHPGLATTATRVGRRLVIQNDLGTTNTHVVVLAVENLTATLTHTDVHLRRLRFFQSLLDRFPVQWSDVQLRRGGQLLGKHYLTTGRYEAPDRPSLEAYLRTVGSRLVFVLDWNRARKRLAGLLSRNDAVDVLRWAADHNLGHMAFLALGGERLVYDAVELAVNVPARYGEPLSEVLGGEATLAITRFALRAAAEGLLAGKSPLLIRDEVRVEVLRHVQASHRRLLDAAADHASLVVESARALRGALVRLDTPEGDDVLRRASQRAVDWEHRADTILVGQRQAARRVEGGAIVAALTSSADDAIDDLEESIFLLQLLPSRARGVIRPILDRVAAVVVATAQEYLKAVEIARLVVDGAVPEDLEDFLVAVDRVTTLEHDADAADRAARAALVADAPEFRSLYVSVSVVRGVEEAVDALMRSALGLRDHILGALSAR